MILKKRLKYKTLFILSSSWIFTILLLKQEYCLCVYDIRTTLIPKELNFFDTNPLGFLLEEKPIWDRNLYVSLCIEVLLSDKHRAEPIVVIAIAIITVEIEQTSSLAVP